jgi:hypothetical protein
MITVLAVAAYIGIAALCVYLDARLSGETDTGPMWLLWPFILPILALHSLFGLVERAGMHRRG